jgi:hypothetical protein
MLGQKLLQKKVPNLDVDIIGQATCGAVAVLYGTVFEHVDEARAINRHIVDV